VSTTTGTVDINGGTIQDFNGVTAAMVVLCRFKVMVCQITNTILGWAMLYTKISQRITMPM
jgi:hypothetical protein